MSNILKSRDFYQKSYIYQKRVAKKINYCNNNIILDIKMAELLF